MATRAERKAKQRAIWAEQARKEREKQERIERYRREHPILSGAVKLVDYHEPKWSYSR